MALEGLRARLHDYVRSHPGVHVLELAEALQLSHPTVLYHLKILEDEGYVMSVTAGKRRCAFDTASHFNGWERDLLILLDGEAGRVFEYVVEHPGSYPRELAQRLGVSDTTIKRAVPELARLELVVESSGFRRRLTLSPGFLPRAADLVERLPPSESRIRLAAILAREESRKEAALAEAERIRKEELENRLFR